MSSIASFSTSLRGCNVWNVWRERHRAPTPGARGRGERLDESALNPSPAPAASAASAALARSIDERLRQARPRLLRIAASFALPPDVAEDIAQEVALRAWPIGVCTVLAGKLERCSRRGVVLVIRWGRIGARDEHCE